MYKITLQLILFFFPWKIRRILLNFLFKFEIHPTAKIGFSILLCKRLEMRKNTKIRHLTFCKQIDKLVLYKNSTIGAANFITGFSTGKSDLAAKKGHFIDNTERKCELILEEHSSITSRHFLDCNGGIYIGKYSIVAGIRSTFLTHSIDIYKNKQGTKAIIIGDYCFISTGCKLLGGSCLPNYSILGAGAVLINAYEKSYFIYGGVPAKPIKILKHEDVDYFNRKEGFVK